MEDFDYWSILVDSGSIVQWSGIVLCLWGSALKKITSPGEGMVGLKDLHKLTSGGKYSLRFDFRDENSKCLVAVYDQIEVIFRIWNMSVHC